MAVAYPAYEHYDFGGHDSGHHGYESYSGDDHQVDYGHHQISERIGESHGHDFGHHEEDEHVDYYVRICIIFIISSENNCTLLHTCTLYNN